MTDKMQILVVEDDKALCGSIMDALQLNGYKPTGAGDVREALAKLRNQVFGCILLDIKLGEESGDDLLTSIRVTNSTLNTSTPILVISGHLDKALVQKVAKHIQGALVKPFDMTVLLENVKKLAG
ncbi:MAG TPA: response regulator [Bdellovibrionota bacterium]|jgi:DNA-binding response OmpR family regulator